MADWAALQEDLILSIAEKVKLIEDFVVFGSVCKSWNEVITKNNKSCLHRQIPWLLMPVDNADDRRQQIYSLTKQKILRNTLYFPELSYEECIPLNYGWVLALFRTGGRMDLLHPISRGRIELPPMMRCRGSERPTFNIHRIKAAAMSANPAKSSDFVVMIVYGVFESYLTYWKPGEREWIRISEHDTGYEDLTYYQDRFYSIDYHGKVWSFTFNNNNIPTPRLVAKTNSRFPTYVVGSLGRLLVMGLGAYRINPSRQYKFSTIFDVYEVDLNNGSYKRITSLGDTAIFVGRKTTIAVDHASQYPNLRPNHIYFSSTAVDCYSSDVGCYSLEDDDDVELCPLSLVHRHRPSFWFIPSLQPPTDCKFIKDSSSPKKIKYIF